MRRFMIIAGLLIGLVVLGFLMNTVFKRPPPPGFENHGSLVEPTAKGMVAL